MARSVPSFDCLSVQRKYFYLFFCALVVVTESAVKRTAPYKRGIEHRLL